MRIFFDVPAFVAEELTPQTGRDAGLRWRVLQESDLE